MLNIAIEEDVLDVTSEFVLTQDTKRNQFKIYQRQPDGTCFVAEITESEAEAINHLILMKEERYEKELRLSITY